MWKTNIIFPATILKGTLLVSGVPWMCFFSFSVVWAPVNHETIEQSNVFDVQLFEAPKNGMRRRVTATLATLATLAPVFQDGARLGFLRKFQVISVCFFLFQVQIHPCFLSLSSWNATKQFLKCYQDTWQGTWQDTSCIRVRCGCHGRFNNFWGHGHLRHDGPAASPAASGLAEKGSGFFDGKKRAALIAKLKTRGGTWWTFGGEFSTDRPTFMTPEMRLHPEINAFQWKSNGKKNPFGWVSAWKFPGISTIITLDGQTFCTR